MIIFTTRFYYTGNKKNSLTNSYVQHNKHALTGTLFTISNYPKKFEGIAIRNRESFTTVCKITV